MYFTCATVPGSGQTNEDWAAATSDLVVVLDGATVRTDTGCRHGVAWFTRKLGAAIIAAAASRTTPLADVLARAIHDVSALHPECDLTHPGTPSAAVGIVRIEGDLLKWLVLGDITVAVDVAGRHVIASDDRVSHTAAAERDVADRYPIGSAAKMHALVAMKHAELAARNTFGGYWIAAGDPDAARQAVIGAVDLDDVRRVVVMTDGAARGIDLFGIHTWDTALNLLDREGPDAYIQQVRSIEVFDPQGLSHPRNKVSDDATVVYAAASRAPRPSGDVLDVFAGRAGTLMGACPTVDGRVL